MKEKVLIIGGAGFIGHNLALKLKNENYEVLVVDSLSVNNYYSLKKNKKHPLKNFYLNVLNERRRLLKKNKIKIVIKDARNYHVMSSLVVKYNPDYIFHLAAVAHANVSNKDPFSTFDHSMRTLENLLDISRNIKKLKNFVYLSSSLVYGQFKKKIVNEKTICDPLGIYGSLKYGAEKLVIGYHQVFNLPYTIIRPSALYGPRCVSGRVLQLFIENLIAGKKIKVNGDGKERLDFTYIDDFTHGLYCVLKNKKAINQIFNLTFGRSRSIIDAIKILKKYFPKMKIDYIPRDKLLPFRGTLSINKSKKLIKYKPKFNLERGIYNYVNWYLKKKIKK
tara:strand:+ start:3587 stop:4591 length:1005 start_codon:yes stop_codon:yes gene_type:complete